jgi:cytochrome c biogenesis protein CcdA
MPLAVKCDSALVLPSLYGLGTGLPVLVFAIMIALGAQSVGKVYNRMAQIEWWGRRLTGAVLIGLGFYSCLVYSYGIPVRDYVLKIVSW